jgi:GT2 family glycosyltransferase
VSSLPPASVVLCTRDRHDFAIETVRALLAGDQKPADVVVIDQSAEPSSALAGLGSPVQYLWSREPGLSRARNLGTRSALHDVIVFVDDDVILPPQWLRSIVAPLAAEGERTVVTGPVLAEQGPPGTFAPSTIELGSRAVYTGRIDADVFAGGNSALNRAALEEVGGFDERLGAGAPYPAADDNDMGYRLLEAGYRIVFTPEAFLYHRSWRPTRAFVRLRWRYGRGKGGFYAKHLSLRDRHMLRRAARDVGARLKRVPAGARSRRRTAGDLSYVAGVVSGAIQWLIVERGMRRP